MKARMLTKLLNNTGYTVHERDEDICIGSPLCADLISVRKDNKKIRYALDTFHQGKASLGSKELLFIWNKLEELIATKQFDDIIAGQDEVENPLPVFSHDNYEIIRSTTDAYGWPNTDVTGRIMYDNQWFKTEREAIERALLDGGATIGFINRNLDQKKSDIKKLEEKLHFTEQAMQRLQAELARVKAS